MIVEDAPLKVRLVTVVNTHAPVVPVAVRVDVPRVTDRVTAPLELKPPLFIAKLPVLNDPAVTVTAFVTLVYALPSVQPPPTPLKLTAVVPNDTLFVVMVLPVAIATKLITPVVEVKATPVAEFVQLP